MGRLGRLTKEQISQLRIQQKVNPMAQIKKLASMLKTAMKTLEEANVAILAPVQNRVTIEFQSNKEANDFYEGLYFSNNPPEQLTTPIKYDLPYNIYQECKQTSIKSVNHILSLPVEFL